MTKRLLILFGGLACIVLSLTLALPAVLSWRWRPDFTMLWTGARFALERPHEVYNQPAITAAQEWLWGPVKGLLPFVYPPSSLPLLTPFGVLLFWPAVLLWGVCSLGLFYFAARRFVGDKAALLSFLTPPVVLTALLAQTALLLGGALLLAISLLRSRPMVAGILFGVVAAVKPQAAILVPVAILAGGHWRAFGGFGLGGFCMVALSLPFGAFLWRDWFGALVAFGSILGSYNLERLGASPSLLAAHLGLSPLVGLCIGAPLGIAAVWRAFKTENDNDRAIAFAIGTLLASPYAMRNELALAAPMLTAALLTGTWRGFLVSLPLYCLEVVTIVPAMIMSLTVANWRRGVRLEAATATPTSMLDNLLPSGGRRSSARY